MSPFPQMFEETWYMDEYSIKHLQMYGREQVDRLHHNLDQQLEAKITVNLRVLGATEIPVKDSIESIELV